jgi:endonuclease G, mitochondrial
MKARYITIIILLSFLTSCNKDAIPTNEDKNPNLEPISSGDVVRHTYYTLAYSENDEQTYWVFYKLTPELINGTQERTEDFRADPMVSTLSASLDDYKGSGYDRGHLCPAADMTLNYTSMSESFYLSNISPQVAGFNRVIWSTLEDRVRKWAIHYSEIYVVTGGILNNKIGTIGVNQVTVPSSFYKIVYTEKNGMIGLILSNHASS